jgi:hypothetical protein
MVPQSKTRKILGLKEYLEINYIYLPPKILAELESEISQIQDLSYYH